MSTSAPAVETVGLVKKFGENRAVDGVDLHIPVGSVCGVLGPNGAGKTTTVRMLATLLRPDGGHATVLGHDVASDPVSVRRRIGLTGQFASVDEDLTAEENLILLARLLGYRWPAARRRAGDLLAAFDLTDAGRRRVGTFSGGMKRRLDIATSIVVAPEVLFLDEPTTGLDPQSRMQVWEIVRKLVELGTTVLLTTQYLEEADRLADRVAVIDRGRVIAEGTTDELKRTCGTSTLSVVLADPDRRPEAIRVLGRVLDGEPSWEPGLQRLTVPAPGPGQATEALEALREHGVESVEFSLGRPTLDEVFLALTGHEAGRTTADGQEDAA